MTPGELISSPFVFGMSVMGANLFWIIYIMTNLIASAILLKKMAPTTYVFLTKGEDAAKEFGQELGHEYFDMNISIMATLVVLIFWPFFVAYWIVLGILFVLWKLLVTALRATYTGLDKVIPDVSIKVKKEAADD